MIDVRTLRTSPDDSTRRHPAARRAAGIATALALVLLLSGCLQLNAQMTIRTDDTVSGRILVAAATNVEDSQINQIQVPSGLEDKVRINNYAANEFRGREIYFTQLSFTEIEVLSQSVEVDGSRPYNLGFRRSGDSVIFNGSVDLTGIPEESAEQASARIDLSFPGQLGSTNGTSSGSNSISWTPEPGGITRMEATAEYADPATRDFAVWMIVGIGAALLVSIAALLAARRSRAGADRLVR